ncbi:hypothetical protein Q8A73_019810 [Channa argus]|nr:hypothetical protein Q8A73_019810 [Channa argus]
MKFHVPVFVFIAVASFHTAISASLESAEKEESVVHYDGLSELQKIDQMEFEAAQKAEAAQMNVTEQQNEDIRYLEAGQNESGELHDVAYDDISEGVVASQPTTQEESESSEEANAPWMKSNRIQPRNKMYWSEKAQQHVDPRAQSSPTA